MPIVKIDMIEGRTEEQKRNLVKEVTDAIVRTVDTKPENVTIILNDQPKINIAKAGKTLADTK
ncbi:4-oxalocrotonate tautomerase [Desulfitispora alkaliphila]|uniref:2-hydroxymuconate tautomerase n=1 Tax=Desulfitispora alkaliphila TaxID=622674 RepID=UPI003D1BD167